MIKKQTTYKAAIYCRLSVEDGNAAQSGSIETQRMLLFQYCKENSFPVVDYYIDDGFSGANFDRPSFEKMLNDIDSGKINLVITKDLSRFGRDYIQAGYYIEKVFDRRNVRYIAVDDNIDTLKNTNDILMPIKNVLNDMYARDISRKTKAAFRAKAKNGEYLASKAPYGYKRSQTVKNTLEVDEEAAEIVQEIFSLASEGHGFNKICRILRERGILNPIAYFNKNNPDYYKADYWRKPYDWHVTSIKVILNNEVYLGKTVYGRTSSKAIKSELRIRNPKDEWIIAENRHTPLVTQEIWDLVQAQISRKRRVTNNGEVQIFAGLLRCSDCNSALTYTGRIRKKSGITFGSYTCCRYRTHGKEYCSIHYISYDDIYSLVLGEIRKNAKVAQKYENKFLKRLTDANSANQQKKLDKSKRDFAAMQNRITDLDKIIKKLYEDSVLGNITNNIFSKMIGEYEQEQAELTAKLQILENELSDFDLKTNNAQAFISIIKKYTDIKELNAVILNELIDKIVVHNKEVSETGEKSQKVCIYYKFVGMV